jgi:hypothetical protein
MAPSGIRTLRAMEDHAAQRQTDKSFLLLFFKKEDSFVLF